MRQALYIPINKVKLVSNHFLSFCCLLEVLAIEKVETIIVSSTLSIQLSDKVFNYFCLACFLQVM